MDTPRTALEIARRAIVLHCTIAAAHGVSKQDLIEWLSEERLSSELTPRELTFFQRDQNPKEEVNWMTWLVEAQVAILWSIGKLSTLPQPTARCDTGLVVAAMPNLGDSASPFIEASVLRSREEIDREEARIYDIHCRVHQARRMGIEFPGGYDKDVVFFRLYGLSWVLGYCGQTWDEVTPDA